jgi:hypothetical protein
MEFMEYVKQLAWHASIVLLAEDADGQVKEDQATFDKLYNIYINVFVNNNLNID